MILPRHYLGQTIIITLYLKSFLAAYRVSKIPRHLHHDNYNLHLPNLLKQEPDMGYNNWNERRDSVLICRCYRTAHLENSEGITEKLLQLITEVTKLPNSKVNV